MDFRIAIAGVGVVAAALLGGCAALDAHAVAETRRLDAAPWYVAVAEPQPAPGACAVVLPVTIDPELRAAFGYGERAGAEGVLLRDTPFLAQSVGASRVLDDVTFERVLEDERRADLPGAPLQLDVALDNLLAQLTRSEVRVPAN